MRPKCLILFMAMLLPGQESTDPSGWAAVAQPRCGSVQERPVRRGRGGVSESRRAESR